MFGIGGWKWFSIVAAGALFVSPPADANAVLSLFHGAAYIMFLALIPVVIVEAIVLTVQTGVSFGAAVIGAAVANLASTLAGIPFAGVSLKWIRGIGPKPLRRAAAAVLRYHVGDNKDPPSAATETAGILSAFILFYLGSCVIEYAALKITLTFDPHVSVFAATLWANTWSYGLIGLTIASLFAIAFLRTRHSSRRPGPEQQAGCDQKHSVLASPALRVPESDVTKPRETPFEKGRRNDGLDKQLTRTRLTEHGHGRD